MEESHASTASARSAARRSRMSDVKCEWCAESLCDENAEYAVRIPGSRLWLNLCSQHFEAYRDFMGQVQFQRIGSKRWSTVKPGWK